MMHKSRICQNLSKLENQIVDLPTMLLADWVSISPSPPFYFVLLSVII